MNHLLTALQPYPFERLRALLADVRPDPRRPIRLSIGEPQHPTPELITRTLAAHMNGLSVYPTTAGSESLRGAIAAWFMRRYGLPSVDPATQVLPVNGTREALFSFAQAVVDTDRPSPLVACPNPFYQIYEGAALLAGAAPVFMNQTKENGYALDLDAISDADWARVQLLYVCSPGNPTGNVLHLSDWQAIFDRADEHGFVVASDECYCDIYDDEARPPIGALEAAYRLNRQEFRNLIVFVSLSKRSNAPGLRSGAIAGDAALIRQFLLYRTYHGCAMSPAVQEASVAAWNDEQHVVENRRKYREKFRAIVPLLAPVLPVSAPDAGFYLWPAVPDGDDERFTRRLFEATNVTVLPGSYLGRSAHGENPGRGYVRMALVPEFEECLEAAERIAAFLG